jgi:oligopeptide transport system ATP-binding protein
VRVAPAVQLEAVHVRFGRTQALTDVSLALAPGETVGIVGESGSGKSTLCRVLIGLQRPTEGRVAVDARAQMLLQDAIGSLSPRMRLRTLLAEPIRIHRLPFAATWARMETLLRQLGIAGLLDKYPHQISGGQARRVAIARALILDPALLIADEPTAGLDVSVQGEILNLLLGLPGLTLLIVSHNLEIVRRAVQRTIVMYLGEIVEDAPAAALFARPAHPYAAALLSANPAIDPARRATPILLRGDIPSPADPPPACRFHTRCPVVQDRCQTEKPALRDIGPGRAVRCHFPFSLESR